MWVDGFNSVVNHVTQNADFVVVAAADPPHLREHGRARGWRNLRLLSAGKNTFRFDLGAEDSEGNQDATISVITRDSDGTLRHFYTGHPWFSEEIGQRGIDLLTPVWNLLDLTPQGRGDWYAELDYG